MAQFKGNCLCELRLLAPEPPSVYNHVAEGYAAPSSLPGAQDRSTEAMSCAAGAGAVRDLQSERCGEAGAHLAGMDLDRLCRGLVELV
eukprot:CAMPEP_0172712094 /NCGR_PEP_ID=MMETSP1074-20121228/60897_1 /TAXON_ID=2916 /ORGANISM="Ceratium fusus, Strain PA161109" /LENGTH=87 /DNA_ID=CAMNT_0013535973 /DNA_START=1059 /DNA_END=1323 /DNA_ORIENTATION=-